MVAVLKDVLESLAIIKVLHDCRGDAVALKSHVRSVVAIYLYIYHNIVALALKSRYNVTRNQYILQKFSMALIRLVEH
jgi:hypothetical protein